MKKLARGQSIVLEQDKKPEVSQQANRNEFVSPRASKTDLPTTKRPSSNPLNLPPISSKAHDAPTGLPQISPRTIEINEKQRR